MGFFHWHILLLLVLYITYMLHVNSEIISFFFFVFTAVTVTLHEQYLTQQLELIHHIKQLPIQSYGNFSILLFTEKMFELLRTNHVEEVVIIVLEIPSKCSVGDLKYRISGISRVPCERILLLFCGQILSNPQSNLPVDVFEMKEVVDEDTSTFRARICMMITPHTVEYKPIDDIVSDPVHEFENNVTHVDHTKSKHKKKTKAKTKFNLEVELDEVQCKSFSALLIKEEYYDEGAFANLTLETLRGPGLWIPLAAAQRILTVCAKVRSRLVDQYKQDQRHHYRNMEAPADPLAHMLDRSGVPHASNEASVASALHRTKADARREYEQEIVRQKKAVKTALAESGHNHKLSSGTRKEHSDALVIKIENIRRRCTQDDIESSADFDEVTGILYKSYGQLRAVNQRKSSGFHVGGGTSIETHRSHSAENTLIGGRRLESPSRVTHALRSLASSASFSGTSSDIYTGGRLRFCCLKHTQEVLSRRESYYTQRRILRTLELSVLLNRLPSTFSGYVTSHNLHAIAKHYLHGFRGLPPRSADPALVISSVEACRLNLYEQRRKVLCVQSEEAVHENLVNVLPVVWYCPRTFVEKFVNLLEELDRERIEDT